MRLRLALIAAAVLAAGCGEQEARAPLVLDTANDVPAPYSDDCCTEWVNRSTMVETAREGADAVVVATVTSIAPGPDLVVAPDEINHRYFVTLRVRERWTGDAPDEVVVNSLPTPGDPPYAVGQDYVLFLIPRRDGPWWRPESPDGRLQILHGRVRPVIAGLLADSVAGMSFEELRELTLSGRRG